MPRKQKNTNSSSSGAPTVGPTKDFGVKPAKSISGPGHLVMSESEKNYLERLKLREETHSSYVLPKSSYEKELDRQLLFLKALHTSDAILFENISFKLDTDNIYEMAKSLAEMALEEKRLADLKKVYRASSEADVMLGLAVADKWSSDGKQFDALNAAVAKLSPAIRPTAEG